MVIGTHWPWWSCTSPCGHWQPGTHVLRPIPSPASSQFQPSEQEPPQARPHSWYTWPPEHWTAGRKDRRQEFEEGPDDQSVVLWFDWERHANALDISMNSILPPPRHKHTYGRRSDCASGRQRPPERSVGCRQWGWCSDTPSGEHIRKPLTDRDENRAPSPPRHDTPTKPQREVHVRKTKMNSLLKQQEI